MMSMRDFYVFDIAVYLTDKDAYYREIDKRVDEYLHKTFISKGLTCEKDPDVFLLAEDHLRKSYGGPWEFNQVVGWIRLYAEPSHIGAHLWWVQAKRLQRKMNKVFYLTTSSNLLATHFYPKDDSDKIFQDTLEDIKLLSEKKSWKGRYVDLESFTRIGPFVDWRQLLSSRSKK